MYNKIVVPLDGSIQAECIITHVENIARMSGGTVELVTVIEPLEIPTRGKIALSEDDLRQIATEQKSEAQKYLDQVAGRLSRSGIDVHPVILTGKPAETLIEYVGNNNVDLVIMATHGRSGITKLFWGSIAEKVLRSVDVPVLLVKNQIS